LDIVHKYYFQIYAWADYVPYNISYELSLSFRPLAIEISDSKAVNGTPLQVPMDCLAILYGKNNSGKTSILLGACKMFFTQGDKSADYLGIDRYDSAYDYPAACGMEDSSDAEKRQQERRYNRWKGLLDSIEATDFAQEIALVPGDIRTTITSFFSQYFENWQFEQKSTGKYSQTVDARVNGHPVAEQGSGPLAALPIIIQLFNPKVQFLAIDEPELGLEPRMQKVLYRAIKDASEGLRGFPKKRILLATHSHLFLDREKPNNNYRVEKNDGMVSVKKLTNKEEIREATFTLMGCDPTDLFFPSNIIIVEGKTDEMFLNAIYAKMLALGVVKSHNIVFHTLGGYDKAPVGIETLVQALKTSTHTPIYRDKICGIFDFPDHDKAHILTAIHKYIGDSIEDRFVHLEKNAIEFYYPLSLASAIAGRSVTSEEYEVEVQRFLSAFKNKHKPTLFGKMFTKGELAEYAAVCVDEMENLDEIDAAIRNLIVRASDLAFQSIE
jgi:hypothetical protein